MSFGKFMFMLQYAKRKIVIVRVPYGNIQFHTLSYATKSCLNFNWLEKNLFYVSAKFAATFLRYIVSSQEM